MSSKGRDYSIKPFVKKFNSYTREFIDKSDDENTIENLKLKINHSLRVLKNAEIISESLNLSSKDYFVAQLCGLFHDIGRFEQFTVYKTFKDNESLYHGALGEKILKNKDFLDGVDIETKEIVYNAVYNHGLREIERTDEKSLLHSKIVRDADKIDIFKIVVKYYNKKGPRNIALEYGLKDEPYISDTVMKKFQQKQLIDKNELKTLNDFKTMQLAWIFDVNFDISKQIIKQNNYLDKIIKNISSIKQIETLQKEITLYYLSQ